MATITPTSLQSLTSVAVAETTLDGNDTFTYKPNVTQYLILRNGTGGALAPNITGADATSQSVDGVGSVDLSGGFTMPSIADGTTVVLELRDIRSYLSGTIAMTSSTGLVASLLEV
jgi:hypothetical protein